MLRIFCLFVICLLASSLGCCLLDQSGESISKIRRQGRGTPKVVSPLRRNMCAQIFSKIDRYIPMKAGIPAHQHKKTAPRIRRF